MYCKRKRETTCVLFYSLKLAKAGRSSKRTCMYVCIYVYAFSFVFEGYYCLTHARKCGRDVVMETLWRYSQQFLPCNVARKIVCRRLIGSKIATVCVHCRGRRSRRFLNINFYIGTLHRKYRRLCQGTFRKYLLYVIET